ncbi:MAG: type IV-A pilus assembly ATPase PilB [Candidatus Aminicenantes bacterium]|nr:type IV-A pilus assembly ATPase PilB [Candidatus Aminicenantes bacterium]
MGSTLGDVLTREKLLSDDQLKRALEYQKKHDVPLGSAFISLNLVSEEDMAHALSRQLGYPYIDLNQFELFPEVIELVPVDVAKKHLIMPVHRIRSFITLAMVDPTDLDVIEDIKFRTGLSIQPVVASESAILNAISRYYGTSSDIRVKQILDEIETGDDTRISIMEDEEDDYSVEEIVQSTEQAPIIKLVNTVFIDAIKKGASDVHFEPYDESFRIRYRLDGTLYEMMNLGLKYKNPVLSRVKILSTMDIAEKRLPQDGRIKMKAKLETGVKKEVDMRVSSIPTIFGEKIVARILDKEMLQLDLTHLGFETETLKIFQQNIIKPWGIILVTGPTGSGKTTTLYSAISVLNSMEKNIMTAEDPVEFYIKGINQVNIKEAIGLDFAASLRSFLRQDPDIMLVGEMRDFETVDIAIKAALTGHLVFSTVHTNDAASTITRLANMNVEPYLIADSVILVVAQRLVRKLCDKCKVEDNLLPEQLIDLGYREDEVKKIKVFKAEGCSHCSNTGYKGRIAIYEVLQINDDMRRLILDKAQSKDIKKIAVSRGMSTLRRSGLNKIKDGVTSVEEVLRETIKDE